MSDTTQQPSAVARKIAERIWTEAHSYSGVERVIDEELAVQQKHVSELVIATR
jgi:hypothetical protein